MGVDVLGDPGIDRHEFGDLHHTLPGRGPHGGDFPV